MIVSWISFIINVETIAILILHYIFAFEEQSIVLNRKNSKIVNLKSEIEII